MWVNVINGDGKYVLQKKMVLRIATDPVRRFLAACVKMYGERRSCIPINEESNC
jgi:hypothetical protein